MAAFFLAALTSSFPTFFCARFSSFCSSFAFTFSFSALAAAASFLFCSCIRLCQFFLQLLHLLLHLLRLSLLLLCLSLFCNGFYGFLRSNLLVNRFLLFGNLQFGILFGFGFSFVRLLGLLLGLLLLSKDFLLSFLSLLCGLL